MPICPHCGCAMEENDRDVSAEMLKIIYKCVNRICSYRAENLYPYCEMHGAEGDEEIELWVTECAPKFKGEKI